MAWFTRFTRFLDAHMVYAQEADEACGMACILMTVFKINKLKPGKEALHKEQEIYKIYGEVTGTEYDGTKPSRMSLLPKVLNKLDVGTWEAKNVGPAGVVAAALDGLGGAVPPGPHAFYKSGRGPVIVAIKWNGAGGHGVVIDTVVSVAGKMYATICDPWDGNVHVTPVESGKTLNYVGRAVPLSWDLGGTRHDYDGEDPGDGSGWIVRRTG